MTKQTKTMNELARKITEALDAADIKWRDYSGRGMCGAYCVGASTSSDRGVYEDDIRQAVADIPEARSPRSDSMGLGTIYYWPGAKLGDDDTGTEDA